jgi:hypothetical protein
MSSSVLLRAGGDPVCHLFHSYCASFFFFCVFVLVQMDPIKVCSQIGLCQFGSTEQRFVSWIPLLFEVSDVFMVLIVLTLVWFQSGWVCCVLQLLTGFSHMKEFFVWMLLKQQWARYCQCARQRCICLQWEIRPSMHSLWDDCSVGRKSVEREPYQGTDWCLPQSGVYMKPTRYTTTTVFFLKKFNIEILVKVLKNLAKISWIYNRKK